MSRRRAGLLIPAMASLAALALVAGCGDDSDEGSDTDTDTADTDALSGVAIDGDGYTFELAEGFEEGDASALGESLGGDAAGFTVDSVATGETLGGFATNVNVVITETLPSDDLDQIVEDSLVGLEEQLDALGVTGTTLEVTAEPSEMTLGDEEARQYDFATTTDAASYAQRQILLLHDDAGYTVTFSADDEAFDEEVADFDAMMGSWSWE